MLSAMLSMLMLAFLVLSLCIFGYLLVRSWFVRRSQALASSVSSAVSSAVSSGVRYDVSHTEDLIERMKDRHESCALATELRRGSWITTSFFTNLSGEQSLEVAKFAISFVLPCVLEMVIRFSDHFPSGELPFNLWSMLMTTDYRYDRSQGVTFSDGLQPHGAYSLGEPSPFVWIDYSRSQNIHPYYLVRFIKIVMYAQREYNIQVFDRPYEACVEMVRSKCRWCRHDMHRCPRRQRFHDIFLRKVMKVIDLKPNPKPAFEPVTFVTEECPVCYESSGDFVQTKCGHVFHGTCLQRWIGNRLTNGQKTCPYCRTQLL